MNSEILNLKVFVDDKNFQNGTHIFYEKRFNIDKVDVVEYYYNHKLDSYFSTKKLTNLKVIKGYTQHHKLFHSEIVVFKNRRPYYIKVWVANMDEADYHFQGYL